jgi:amyloid beta precursor protein binding protein 1
LQYFEQELTGLAFFGLGIGRFVIADEAIVQEADLGVNFFLDHTQLGKSRAQACTELLVELNPDVQGEWYPKDKVSHDSSRLQPALPLTSSYSLTSRDL